MDIRSTLLAAIDRAVKGGRTLYALAKVAGLKPEVVYRFVAGDRDLRLSSAAKLCGVLGLELKPAGRPPGRRNRPGR